MSNNQEKERNQNRELVGARKQANRTTIVWLLIAMLAVVGGTFAWFNFQTSTNVEPGTGGTVTNGEGNLLISNSPNGPFDTSCDLILDSSGGDLDPISTDDLNDYYKAAAQNASGISILYTDATKDLKKCTLHGYLYLKCEGSPLNVYLYKNRMTFGKEIQAIAAMRLGLKITSNEGNYTYIFNLNDMADTSSAEKRRTTSESNVVVQSTSSGAPNYTADTSLNIMDYSSIGRDASDMAPTPGKNKLVTVQPDEIVKVEYVLYLEGCDENCINAVQKKAVAMALSFAASSAK